MLLKLVNLPQGAQQQDALGCQQDSAQPSNDGRCNEDWSFVAFSDVVCCLQDNKDYQYSKHQVAKDAALKYKSLQETCYQ